MVNQCVRKLILSCKLQNELGVLKNKLHANAQELNGKIMQTILSWDAVKHSFIHSCIQKPKLQMVNKSVC